MTPGERLADWWSKVQVTFLNLFLVGINPVANLIVKVYATRIRDDPNSTPDQKAYMTQILEGGDVTKTIGSWIMAMLGVIPSLMGSGRPQGRVMEYEQDRKFTSFRLDPISTITAWRRDPEKYAHLFDDLRDLGWDEDRIEALKFFTLFYPSPMDLVHWQAREVFEPKMIEKYGLRDELGELRREDFYKAGMTDEQIDNYWMAHWEHPELRTIIEMLRRTGFTEEDMRAWFRLVEIPPYWRDKLIEISYEIPTRVDVRRWWDMRTIDEGRLREIYAFQGYHGKDLDDYVLWTKVYVAFPDLIARWKNGWITLDEVKSELTGYGMPADRLEELIQTKIKTVGPERVEGERDLTKTDIYKGVKTGALTRGEAAELLMDLGFDTEEAEYLLTINIPTDEEDVVIKERELTKSDIKAAVKEELLTPLQAVDRLVALRYSLADSQFLVSIFERLIPIAKIEPQRELTKGDIAKGLSKGILAPGEARNMLLELRYSEEDADYLISINMPSEEAIEEEQKRQLAKTDIRSAFRVELITADEAISRLEGIGYSPDDAQFLVSIYLAIAELVPITKPREASKADIVEAVKRGLLTAQEGYMMLIDLDFTPEAAAFILEVRAEVSPFSPINFAEFKDLTQKYRRAAGMGVVYMTEEIKKAAEVVITLTSDVKVLTRSIEEEKRGLILGEPIPEAATKRLKTLQVKRNRAIAKLEQAKTEYNRQVAEWKHGLPP